jgi:hypothetical protein
MIGQPINKDQLKDDMGRPLTQGLFLEINYDAKYAVYTLKDYNHEWNGKLYPSLKLLYLEMNDPIEYDFASRYLLGWQHWKRLNENKILRKHFDEWREELELKLRAKGVREMFLLSESENGNFQAAKFLADRGWEKRGAGRPSKLEKEQHEAVQSRLEEEWSADVKRMEDFRKGQ